MVAKIINGSSLYGVLEYNHRKVVAQTATVLHKEKIICNMTGDMRKELYYNALSFEPWLQSNPGAKKSIVHISLNPAPGDQLSDEAYCCLTKRYLEKMGFAGQPYIIYKHHDIDRTHIHVVTVRIRENGSRITDRYEWTRNKQACRELETEFALTPIGKQLKQEEIRPLRKVTYEAGEVRRQIRNTILNILEGYSFQTFGEYNALLSCYHIHNRIVQGEEEGNLYKGIIYSALDAEGNPVGHPIKSSRLGKQFGYRSLERQINRHKEKIRKEKAPYKAKNRIYRAMEQAQNKTELKALLQKQGIDVVLRENAEGRLTGVTFIDHKEKMVYNGSRLGKAFSANALHKRFTEGQSIGQTGLNPTVFSDTPTIPDSPETDNYQTDLAGLFEMESRGSDWEEEAFRRRMKKKPSKRHTRLR